MTLAIQKAQTHYAMLYTFTVDTIEIQAMDSPHGEKDVLMSTDAAKNPVDVLKTLLALAEQTAATTERATT